MSALKKMAAYIAGVIVTTIVLLTLGWFVLQHQLVSYEAVPLAQNTDYFHTSDIVIAEASWHELLLAPYVDMEKVLTDYALRHEEHLRRFSAESELPPEWLRALGANGYEGYVSWVDLDWPPFAPTPEETLELARIYHGVRIVPVFSTCFSSIIDYYVIGADPHNWKGLLHF